jgi:PIN domain nuclease of toxin-antitoxin system
MLNLDTHILLFAFLGELTATEERQLRGDTWSISSIVLWEIAKLSERGRISIGPHNPLLRKRLAEVHVWPITLPVVRNLSQLDFRSDPADELIAATSVTHGIPLVTRDRQIRASSVVPLVA